MSSRRKPSYFDDDYDERMQRRKRFTFKSLLQILAYFLIVVFKAIRNAVVSFRENHPIDEIIRNHRRRRRLSFGLFILSMFIFAIMIGAVMLAVSNENKKIAQFDSDAGAVCSSYIIDYGTPSYENMYVNYGVEGYRMTGLCYAREMDFNNDGTSELLVCYNDSGVYQASVWGYVGKDFNELYHCKLAQTTENTDDVWLTIYRHNNKYYVGVHDTKDVTKVSLYGMKGDEFDKRYSAVYDEQTQTFSIRDKVDYTSFERIKLSVLREEKASVVLDTISATIDGFKTDDSALKDASEKEFTREDAYREIVSSYRQKYGEPTLKTESGSSYIDGLAFVKLIDLDGDGKDELIVSYRNSTMTRDEDEKGDYVSVVDYKYTTEVYTFNNKKAKKIFEKDDVSQKQNEKNDKYFIIQNDGKKHNLCFNNYTSTEKGHIVTATSTIFEYDGTSVEQTYKAKFVTDYGYKEYYIDDEETWSKKFNEEGYKVPFFDGTSVYSSTEFTILYLQRTAGNSESVKTQLNDTKSTINKL